MGTKASEVVNIITSWVGKNEKDGSFKEIIDLYNTQKPLPRGYKLSYKDEWCAATVTAVFIKLDALELIHPECSCQRMIEGLNKKGIFIEDENRVPNVGDIVFYDWQDTGIGDNKGWADHVGIVTAVNGNRFTVIEGNKSEAVGVRTCTVNQKHLRGFAAPHYDTESSFYPKYEGKSTSIVDALNSLGVLSSFVFRVKIAKANGIDDYKGLAVQNTKMLALLKAGKLKRGI